MTIVPILVMCTLHWLQDQPEQAIMAWEEMVGRVLLYFGMLFLVALVQMSWQAVQEAVPEEQQLKVAALLARQLFFALYKEVLPL